MYEVFSICTANLVLAKSGTVCPVLKDACITRHVNVYPVLHPNRDSPGIHCKDIFTTISYASMLCQQNLVASFSTRVLNAGDADFQFNIRNPKVQTSCSPTRVGNLQSKPPECDG